jgi:hypothetical protein
VRALLRSKFASRPLHNFSRNHRVIIIVYFSLQLNIICRQTKMPSFFFFYSGWCIHEKVFVTQNLSFIFTQKALYPERHKIVWLPSGIHVGHFSELYFQLQKIISYDISYMVENVDSSQGLVEIRCGWHWLMLTCNLLYVFISNLLGTNISHLIIKIPSRFLTNFFHKCN